MRRPKPVLPLLFALLIAACGGDDAAAPKDIVVTGEWAGRAGAGNGVFDIEITMTETEGSVSGTGRFVAAGAVVAAFTLSGTHTFPEVALTIVATGFQDALFTGSFTGDNTITGQLNGSGFENEPVTVTRTTGAQ